VRSPCLLTLCARIHDSCSVLPAHRLVHSPTLALIQTRIPLLLGPTPTHHPDPHVHAQGLVLVRPTIKGDAEGAFRRRIVAMVDAEGQLGEDVTQVKIYPTTTGRDDSHSAVRGSQVDDLALHVPPSFYFIIPASPTPC